MMRSFAWSYASAEFLCAAGKKSRLGERLCTCSWQEVNGLNLPSLFLGMRDAEDRRGDEKLALVRIHGVQVERIVVVSGKNAGAEVVDFSLFRGEVSHGKRSGTYF